MQSDYKQIYKSTAERTGQPEELYKALGNFVFHNLYTSMRRPSHLILKLRGVGSWYLRKMRMEKTVELFPPDYDKKPEDFTHPLQLFAHENKKEVHTIFKARLLDYNKYIELRNSIRKIRYETQTLLEPTDREK